MENIRIPMFLAIQLGISILTLIYVDGNNKEGARTSRRLSFSQVPPSTSTTDKYGKVHAPMGRVFKIVFSDETKKCLYL